MDEIPVTLVDNVDNVTKTEPELELEPEEQRPCSNKTIDIEVKE